MYLRLIRDQNYSFKVQLIFFLFFSALRKETFSKLLFKVMYSNIYIKLYQ